VGRGVSVGNSAEKLATWGLDGHLLPRKLLTRMLDQILIEGTFHADPHPGSLFVTPKGNLVLLDLRSVARIDPRQQSAVRRALCPGAAGSEDHDRLGP
jgi:ubiquinone biosynthesis protein